MHGQQSIKKRSYSYFAVSLPSYITSLEMRLLFGRTMFWISNEMPRRSGLRRGSVVPRLAGLRVRITPG